MNETEWDWDQLQIHHYAGVIYTPPPKDELIDLLIALLIVVIVLCLVL